MIGGAAFLLVGRGSRKISRFYRSYRHLAAKRVRKAYLRAEPRRSDRPRLGAINGLTMSSERSNTRNSAVVIGPFGSPALPKGRPTNHLSLFTPHAFHPLVVSLLQRNLIASQVVFRDVLG